MSTSPVNRRPEGTPAGGQFAPGSHSEAAGIALADSTARPINLAPGETDYYPDLADGPVIDLLAVSRDREDPDKYLVRAEHGVDFHALLEHELPELSEEERDAWLSRNRAVIEDFMEERYEADLFGDDWSAVTAECTTTVTSAGPTETMIAEAAWNNTKITALANEEDPGTFGSENLSRLLRERVEASAVIPEVWSARAEAGRLTPEAVDATVAERLGKRELPDAAALSIAYDMGMSGPYPTMARLARTGFADREELRSDLRKIYERDANSPRGPRGQSGRHLVYQGGWS